MKIVILICSCSGAFLSMMIVGNPMNDAVGCDKCVAECPAAAISFASKAQFPALIKAARKKRSAG